MPSQISGAKTANCVPYRFHLRMCCWVTVRNYPAWSLADNHTVGSSYQGAVGLVSVGDSEIAHVECTDDQKFAVRRRRLRNCIEGIGLMGRGGPDPEGQSDGCAEQSQSGSARRDQLP